MTLLLLFKAIDMCLATAFDDDLPMPSTSTSKAESCETVVGLDQGQVVEVLGKVRNDPILALTLNLDEILAKVNGKILFECKPNEYMMMERMNHARMVYGLATLKMYGII